MQNQENEWLDRQDEQHTGDEPEEASQVPSTLLPDVLYRLGLSTERPESSVADLMLKLQSGTWEERTLALQTLGKLDHPIPINLLSSFLQDEDETVRAAAVHLLGTRGKRAPLHMLVEALHDSNWHVREAAVFALAKQGTRVPAEVLMTALHDHDGSVREAAEFVLQQSPAIAATPSISYGQLLEETSMQPEYTNDKNNHDSSTTLPVPYEAAPRDSWNGTFTEYSSTASPRVHTVNEQARAYAAGHYSPHDVLPQEPPPYEYAGGVAERGEKITSYRVHRKPHKGWWAAIIVTAMFCLGLGRVSTMVMPQLGFGGSDKSIKPVNVEVGATKGAIDTTFIDGDPTYQQMMLANLASTFKIAPAQIMNQLNQGKSVEDIAVANGVSIEELQKTELRAFDAIFKDAVSRGVISSQDVDNWTAQLRNSKALCSKLTMSLLVNALVTPSTSITPSTSSSVTLTPAG